MNKLKNTKKGMLILSIILLFLVIGAASAADDKISEDDLSAPTDSVDEVASADNDDVVSTSEPTKNVLGSSDAGNLSSTNNNKQLKINNDNLLSEESPTNSFKDLDNLIKGVEAGDTLVLGDDYSLKDGDVITGININKPITILGNGHVINCSGKGSAFNVLADNVVLNNITILNGYSTDLAASIYWKGNDGQFLNSYIAGGNIQNTVFGRCGGISWEGENGLINYCEFTDFKWNPGTGQQASYGAGAVFGLSESIRVYNSYFHDISGGCSALQIYPVSSKAEVINCTFINNPTRGYGHLFIFQGLVENCLFDQKDSVYQLYYSGVDVLFKNCTFKKTSGTHIDLDGVAPINLQNCTFIGGSTVFNRFDAGHIINNTKFYNMGSYLNIGTGSKVFNSEFINSSAYAIYIGGDGCIVDNCTFINQNVNGYGTINFNGAVKNNIISNCKFINNTAGRGVYINNAGISVKVDDTNQFIDCIYQYGNIQVVSGSLDFTAIADLWVSPNGTGNGSSSSSPTNLDNAFVLIDVGGTIHFLGGVYNRPNSQKTIQCSLIGEEPGVIINGESYKWNDQRLSCENIVFNNTKNNFYFREQFNFINCSFQNGTLNKVFQTQYVTGGTVRNCSFENMVLDNVFDFDAGINAYWCGNLSFYNCIINQNVFKDLGSYIYSTFYNLTFDGCTLGHVLNPIFPTIYQYAKGNTVENLTIKNCNITNDFVDSTGFISGTNKISQWHSMSYNNISIIGCNYTGSNPLFNIMTETSLNIINVISVNNVNKKSLFVFSGKDNVLTGCFVESVDGDYIFVSNYAMDFKDVFVSDVEFNQGWSIVDGSTLTHFVFTDVITENKIGTLNNNCEIKDSTFIDFKGNIQIDGSNVEIYNSEFYFGKSNGDGAAINIISGKDVFIDSCTFINNTAVNGGAVYINNLTNDSYILNSIFINNTVSGFGGAVFVEPNIYYYINQNTRRTFNTSFRFNDLFDNNTLMYMEDVWVQNGASGNGTYDDPTNLDDAFSKISPFGNIHFRIDGDIIDYSLNIHEKSIPKMNLTFLGNNTVIKGFSFVFTEYATGVSIYNISFTGYVNDNVIKWVGDDGLVVNCCFCDNGGYDVGNGVALQVFGDNLRIINSSFINNIAGMDDSVGGAIYCNGSNLIISNCNFTNNLVYDAGAHIYLTENVIGFKISNSIFRNGDSLNGNRKGSGIYILGSKFSVINSSFNNVRGRDGGALFVGASGSIIGSSFYNNSAVNGSAIYINKVGVSIINCEYASPKYDENNNLIIGYVYSTQKVNLVNNTLSFIDLNHVVSEANSNLSLQFNYKYFEDYDEPFTNGVSINKTLTIEGNDHILDGDNKARVFVVSVSDVKISNVCFVNASRDLHVSGGAILWNGDSGVLFNSSFKNCIAISSSTSYLNGGAIYLTGANANITFCTFDSCVANHAASIWIRGQNSYISDCVFTNNYADQYDATIWFDSNSNGFVLRNSIFKDNNASRWAGALRIQTNGEVIGCIFDNNLVKKSNKTQSGADDRFGGAIYLTVDDVIIKDCTFSNNCLIEGVSMKGGAIYSKNIFALTNCTFINNSALMGSAIYYDGSSVLSIDDCVFAVGKYDEENNKLPGYIFTNGNVIFNNVTLSFTDLSYLINNTDNIDLQFNYLYFNNYDQAFITGVPINKETVINGNDKVIDGNFTARIFNVSSTVVLNNLNLINGNASLGGAIYSTGDLTLTNVTFANNTAVNGSAIYVIKTTNHWDNITFKDNNASNATVYFDGDSTLYSNNLSFINNQVPKLNIVGTNHIYSPIIYVSNNHIGFGIITDEATSLTCAVDNILPNGMIIILDDYDVESIIKFTNLNNITVVGNKTKLKDKYLFILPIIQKYIKKKQIVF